jgi:hypothetical protein
MNIPTVGSLTIAPALSKLDCGPDAGRGRGAEAEMLAVNAGIRPALERAKKAVAEGKSALVCVVTDHNARATTAAFTNYST